MLELDTARLNKDWTGVLKNTKGETTKAAEEREHSQADEGFIEAIFNGNEIISRLQTRITFITQKRDAANYLSTFSQSEIF